MTGLVRGVGDVLEFLRRTLVGSEDVERRPKSGIYFDPLTICTATASMAFSISTRIFGA